MTIDKDKLLGWIEQLSEKVPYNTDDDYCMGFHTALSGVIGLINGTYNDPIALDGLTIEVTKRIE